MNKYSSVLGQILGLFPKAEFYEAVRETRAEKGAKGFSSWDHFAAMLFCQIGQAHSIREIVGGLSRALGALGVRSLLLTFLPPCNDNVQYLSHISGTL